ncbi:aromatic amino acid lyase [Bacillus cereus]
MDFLKVGMAELANISERRIERLVNPQLNDLPAFLSPEPGLPVWCDDYAICCSITSF